MKLLLTILLFPLFLLAAVSHAANPCPPFEATSTPIYKDFVSLSMQDGTVVQGVQAEDGTWKFPSIGVDVIADSSGFAVQTDETATATEFMFIGTTTFGSEVVGHTPVANAKQVEEYDQKVKQCEIANGEFSDPNE